MRCKRLSGKKNRDQYTLIRKPTEYFTYRKMIPALSLWISAELTREEAERIASYVMDSTAQAG